MFSNFGKWYGNFESSCTLLSKVVELWQLSQLYNFAKLRKLPKVEVDVFLMEDMYRFSRPGLERALAHSKYSPPSIQMSSAGRLGHEKEKICEQQS